MLAYGNTVLKVGADWLDYLPPVRPYTMRLRYKMGTTPTFNKGVGTLVDPTRNIWDLTYESTDWSLILYDHDDLLEVLGADIEGVTQLNSAFNSCDSLQYVRNVKTCDVEYTDRMFYLCRQLRHVDLFDTSSITNASYMFHGCESLTSVPAYDLSNNTTLEHTFYFCTHLANIPTIDASKVTNMDHAFFCNYQLTSIPVINTSNVTNMVDAFYGCGLTTISQIDVSSVTNVDQMFGWCTRVESGILDMYNTLSNLPTVPYHDETFSRCGIDTTTGTAELAQIPDDWK